MIMVFPGDSDGKESSCSVGDLGLIPGLGRSVERGMATHSSILAGESQGHRSLVGCRLWGCTESDTTEATQQQQQEGFLGGVSDKESVCHSGDPRQAAQIPGSGRSPARGNDNPIQCSHLENPMDRGAWWATVGFQKE